MTPLDLLTAALAGRYEVEREIGAGGMATVYLARDLKHNRKVALKVLKPELGAVLGVERFLSEIQVTANLQHPNLLPLFDSGEANGLLFYVMPFVEGESLRARLDREKQLPVDEAVRIAVAIAGALDYAHQHGVIHRDMKPENVLLQAGQPVIADFGIALAVSNAGGARVTQTGLSLGTPQYMSPEQATGDRTIDARSDIYSLAAMTYEMLVGDPPHVASTAQAIVAKVLTERPPSVLVARPSVGEAVAHAVERGLEKLPADRWSSAAEFADAMLGKLSTGAMKSRTRATMAGTASALGASRGARRVMAGMATLTVTALAAAGWFATRKPAAPVLATFEADMPDSISLYGGAGRKIALSPDGSLLAFVGEDGTGRRMLYLRRLADGVVTPVRGTENSTNPSFSPDADWLAFQVNPGGMKKVPLNGGAPETVADSSWDAVSWGADGEVVVGQSDGALRIYAPGARVPRRTIKPDTVAKVFRLRWPHVLPGGRYALVALDGSPVVNQFDALRLGVVDLSDGRVEELGVAGSSPQFVAPDRIVYGATGGAVMTVRFSLSKRRVVGTPERIASDIWQGSGGATGFAVSQAGVLALHTGSLQLGNLRRVLRVDAKGVGHETQLGKSFVYGVRVSPDGRRVALSATRVNTRSQEGDVLIAELATGATARLLADSISNRGEWHRDGRKVVYIAGPGPGPVGTQAWDRSDAPRTVTAMRVEEVSPGPAGGYWAFRVGAIDGTPDADIWVARDDSLDKPRPFIATRGVSEYKPRISPDGRLLAFVSQEGGLANVFVQAVPGPGGRVPVSIGGGTEPMWAPDGKSLIYRTTGEGRHFVRATVLGGAAPSVAARDSLFPDPYFWSTNYTAYDVLPGGRELLVLSADSTTATQRKSVTMVMNWQQMLNGARSSVATPER